jgi:TRAP-type mannitol/chloroaromatic compound transport system permease small subunit
MNPYEPPDDESQLDRIERKIGRLNGWYLLTLLIVALLTGVIELLAEIVSARWKF